MNKKDKTSIALSILAVFLSLSILFPIVSADNETVVTEPNTVNLYMFYGQGCPHCSKLELFLEDLSEKYPSLNVKSYEIYRDTENRELFQEMAESFNTQIQGVPTVFIDDKVIVGFSNSIGQSIETEIQRCIAADCGDPIEKVSTKDTTVITGDKSPSEDPEKTSFKERLTIPLVISAAAVDAVNPCAFAVLIILMSVALSLENKKRALRFGLAFTASIYIAYFLMGLGLFSALQLTGISHWFYIFVTGLAVIVGLLNLKDYFWYGKGFLMEIPVSWRPAMKKIIRSATSPFGAFLVGFVVSLFELPCTGGPYIVILGLLAKNVTRDVGIMYLLLYNLVFVAPLLILTYIIYKGLSTTEKLENIRQRNLRVLHLIAGILMLGIAVAMILSLTYGWV